jgi:hypothetical protein
MMVAMTEAYLVAMMAELLAVETVVPMVASQVDIMVP